MDITPLYLWYRKNKRNLPFRKTRKPYPIWVSEIMLQQTRLSSMLNSYKKFMQRFPSIHALGHAHQEDVISAWQGLGYYSRAVNLHKGAKQILENHKGKFPSNLQDTLNICGIGPYTAAAILSICYELPIAVIDGNVIRVLARLFHIRSSHYKPKDFKHKAQEFMNQRKKYLPSEHNQAIMELGSLVCKPKVPNCTTCPLQFCCLSFQKGGIREASKIPKLIKADQIQLHLKLWLILSYDEKKLLILKESNSRFLKNLWFLPYMYHENTMSFKQNSLRAPGFPDIIKKISIVKKCNFPQKINHSITNHKIIGQIEVLYIEEKETKFMNSLSKVTTKEQETQWRWVKKNEAKNYIASSLGHKALQVFEDSNSIDTIY